MLSFIHGGGAAHITSKEIPSYKRDAANLLVNRIKKKMRGYLHEIHEFADFKEVSFYSSTS